MNLPTIIISLLLITLFALAIRRIIKKGTCGGCGKKDSCSHYSHS